jgi:hypothetical protein
MLGRKDESRDQWAWLQYFIIIVVMIVATIGLFVWSQEDEASSYDFAPPARATAVERGDIVVSTADSERFSRTAPNRHGWCSPASRFRAVQLPFRRIDTGDEPHPGPETQSAPPCPHDSSVPFVRAANPVRHALALH